MTKGWTYQALIDDKMSVTAYCHNPKCHHKQELDLKKLRDRFGPDAPAMNGTFGPSFVARNATGMMSA